MTSRPASPFVLRLGAAASFCLAVAGGVAFHAASLDIQPPPTAAQRVTITARGYDPASVTIPAGQRTFQIVNTSDRPIEWEILDGVMVVAERENIAPGFTQGLTVRLAAGSYQMTCGLLSNPVGAMTVTPATDAPAPLVARDYLGALSEYRVYLVIEGRKAIAAAETLRAAIAADDLPAARAAWTAARAPWRRIEPMAIYLAGRKDDPGYHRLEQGLFDQGSTEGLAPLADGLVADLQSLADRMRAAPLSPDLLTRLPADMARHLAEGIRSGADLSDLDASLEGLGKLGKLLAGVTRPVSPALAARIEDDLAAAKAQLQTGDKDRRALADSFVRIADTFHTAGLQ